jgi:pimeloyl-ACP methyl ester carboxylesterase
MDLKPRGKTPAFRSAWGRKIAGSVAESGMLSIGGMDQFVLIRGRDSANPVLIVLHGGPGSPETALLRACNAVLEDSYTVVYWDQRGAGRSFHKTIDPASMTIERMVADLDELVDAVLARFGKQKVALLAHSWGTLLGAIYAARHPAKVSVYIGVAQIADMAKSELKSYEFVLAEAGKRDHRKAIRALRAIGPPPYRDLRSAGVQRRWLVKFGGTSGPGFSILRLVLRALRTPEASLYDLVRLARGSLFSLRLLEPQLMDANIQRDVPRFDVPVVFILGRLDHQVVATVSAEYFEALTAPQKKLFWLERSGHLSPFEEPEAFNKIMIEAVRPMAGAAGT